VLRLSVHIVCRPSLTIPCLPPSRFVATCPSVPIIRCLRPTHPIICGWQEPPPHIPIPDPGPFEAEDWGYDPYGEWEGDVGGY
jgi:hypothetical protein